MKGVDTMPIDRNVVRVTVPPMLAIGLVAFMVRPIDVAPGGSTSTTVDAVTIPSTGGGYHEPCRGQAAHQSRRPDAKAIAVTCPPPGSTPAGNVEVPIAPVAFQAHAVVSGGHVRTAVLVNVAESQDARASIAGVTDCSVVASPGQPAWLDCSYTGAAKLFTVVVTLANGRRFTNSMPSDQN
jgi:hypothetical protein